MEDKNKGFASLAISLILISLYRVLDFVYPVILTNWRYASLLFFVIFAFFTFFIMSVYFLSFAYPKRRTALTLIFSLVVLPVFIVIYTAGTNILSVLLIMFPHYLLMAILFLLIISFFISRTVYKIDSVRRASGKMSILIKPFIVSLIYFGLFNIVNRADDLSRGTYLLLLPVLIILMTLGMCLGAIFYYVASNIGRSKELVKTISLIVFIILSIFAIIGFFSYSYFVNHGLDILKDGSLISFITSPVILLFYLMLRE